ncbi:unnamed protein product [Strongylus vulgaris]|uniref:Uncharacterized protein n=1 Tax=Strongylus vulgaris TaxID=40348 RepID=A0A3P7LDA0_STRVU|nr:unnamed protein product [Strongylus vulgaris]
MVSITKSAPASNLFTVEKYHHRFYLLKYAPLQTMKTAKAPGPDHVSTDLLRAGGHRLHEILAEHLTSYLQNELSATSRKPPK